MSKLNILAFCVIAICEIIMCPLINMTNAHNDELVQSISKRIIRFHVRANSDSKEDQELKLLVKDAVVTYVGELTKDANDRETVKKIINDNLANIENVAKGVITKQKKEYNVRAYFEYSYFPVKTYGDLIFPAGEYEAFRVDIGNAEGRNWWCVIFPKLCFLDGTYAISDETVSDLKEVLDEDELALLYGKSLTKSATVSYDFFLLKLFRGCK